MRHHTRLLDPTALVRLLGVAAALTGSGCGGGGMEGAQSDLAPSPAPPDIAVLDLKPPGYPAGPYGADPGSVLPNFTFRGYWSPTKTTGLANSESFGEVTFDALRTSGHRFAIVQLSAFW